MPPRKRRKSHFDESETPTLPNEEERPGNSSMGHRGQNRTEKKQAIRDHFIVISDSEGEEENTYRLEKNIAHPDRRRTSVKRKIAQMTEEEQLALAVRMSEQEANHVNYSQEEEEELLRKAIEESLHSCTVSEPCKATTQQNTDPLHSSKETLAAEDHSEKQPLFQNVTLSEPSNNITVQQVSKEALTMKEPVKSQELAEEQPFSQASALSEFTKGVTAQQVDEEAHSIQKTVFTGDVVEEGLLTQIFTVSETPLSSGQQTSNEAFNSPFVTKEVAEEESLSQYSAISSQSRPKCPVVRLMRLSQDIVESSSVILSPKCRDPFSEMESGTASSCPSNSSEFVSLFSNKALALSPVFPKRSPCRLGLTPRRLFQGENLTSDPMVQEIDDQCSHSSESAELDSTMLPYSLQAETFKDKTATNFVRLEEKNTLFNGDTTGMQTGDSSRGLDSKGQTGSTVHYYWGVPFCPKGEDPNLYTQVILCQLEVYEKSLKKAQSKLLQKMNFGEPVHLSAPPLRRSERGKSDSQDSLNQESEDLKDDDTPRPVDNEEEDSEKQLNQCVSSRQPSESLVQGPPEESSFPAQDEEDKNSQTLLSDTVPGAGTDLEPVSCENLVTPTSNINSNNDVVQTEDGEEEEELTVCPETQPSPERARTVVAEAADLTEGYSLSQSSVPPSEENIPMESERPQDVECPLCGQQFTPSQIELHAAYCDGTNKSDEQETIVLRRAPRLPRKNLTDPDDLPSVESGKHETCYICKTLVSLKDYQNHVDNCLQTAARETQRNRTLRSTKETSGQDGRLLSMLEQTESVSTESHSNAQEFGRNSFSPPRDDESAVMSSFSESPIKSFISISEAKDCLVDFKKQFSHKPSRRGTRQISRGRRRRL
ncbi:BRCA1-A complex subunit RAP80 isoform X2 [Xenopus laevis]|nr:BRCA1-A complex subunit RAP80 isoform X2 [Xenopus laevis]